MTTKSTYMLVLSVLIIAGFFGCRKSTSTEPSESTPVTIYTNSFESPADTIGWLGYGAREFRDEAPAMGGRRSLFVSGGCIVPHAFVNFVNTAVSGRVTLNGWGRRLQNGGGVSLRVKGDHTKSIGFGVSDSVWRAYASTDTLSCSQGDTLCLEMMSGGFAPGAMLIDLIEVGVTEQ